MSLYDSIQEANINQFDKIHIGFQKHNGQYTTAFPSIEIKILGQTLPMLLDTGATAKLSEDAQLALGTKAHQVGTSYIVSSIFNQWREQHPEWQVIEKADIVLGNGEGMIKVPEVQIGNRTIGPVWFTRRDDINFHQGMAKWMDRKTEGAIGGSLFQYLKVIVDFPNEVAYISDQE